MPKRLSASINDATLKQRFGTTVRQYRQRLAISQEELAWRADMHRTYLADVERGVRNLSLTSMARLIRGIDVSFSDFFGVLETLENGNGVAARRVNGAKKAGSAARRKVRPAGRNGQRGGR